MEDFNNDVLPQEQQDEINAQTQAEAGKPSPADFIDYDQYVAALSEWQARKTMSEVTQGRTMQQAVRDRLLEAQQRQQQAFVQEQARLTPYEDDPNSAQRASLITRSLEFNKQAILCDGEGKTDEAKRWRARAKDVENELSALPPTPEQQYMEKMIDEHLDFNVGKLFDPRLKDAPEWENPRLQNDSAIVVERAMHRAKGYIRLPLMDDPRSGNPLPCAPKNMVKVPIPDDQLERFRRVVFADPNVSIDQKFRKAWKFLTESGLASHAERAFEPKTEDQGETAEEDPNKMSWKRFCEWREETENRRRGGPRQGFVMPKRRNV